MTVQCCMCDRVLEDAQWVDRKPASDDSVSHTYCPVCLNLTLREYRIDWSRTKAASEAREAV